MLFARSGGAYQRSICLPGCLLFLWVPKIFGLLYGLLPQVLFFGFGLGGIMKALGQEAYFKAFERVLEVFIPLPEFSAGNVGSTGSS